MRERLARAWAVVTSDPDWREGALGAVLGLVGAVLLGKWFGLY